MIQAETGPFLLLEAVGTGILLAMGFLEPVVLAVERDATDRRHEVAAEVASPTEVGGILNGSRLGHG